MNFNGKQSMVNFNGNTFLATHFPWFAGRASEFALGGAPRPVKTLSREGSPSEESDSQQTRADWTSPLAAASSQTRRDAIGTELLALQLVHLLHDAQALETNARTHDIQLDAERHVLLAGIAILDGDTALRDVDQIVHADRRPHERRLRHLLWRPTFHSLKELLRGHLLEGGFLWGDSCHEHFDRDDSDHPAAM